MTPGQAADPACVAATQRQAWGLYARGPSRLADRLRATAAMRFGCTETRCEGQVANGLAPRVYRRCGGFYGWRVSYFEFRYNARPAT